MFALNTSSQECKYMHCHFTILEMAVYIFYLLGIFSRTFIILCFQDILKAGIKYWKPRASRPCLNRDSKMKNLPTYFKLITIYTVIKRHHLSFEEQLAENMQVSFILILSTRKENSRLWCGNSALLNCLSLNTMQTPVANFLTETKLVN